MIKYQCKYHPLNEALIFCSRCDAYLCSACVTSKDNKMYCKKCYNDYFGKTEKEKIQASQKSISKTKNNNVQSNQEILKQSRSKKILAIILGAVVGFTLRFIISFVITIITRDSLPQDVTIILEIFASFFAGTFAASLAINKGWLIGLLTQILQIFYLITSIILLFFPVIEFSFPTWHVRLAIYCLISATVAGAVTHRYRHSIKKFLKVVLGVFAGGFAIVYFIFGLLIEIIPIYWGIKIFLTEAKLLKAVVVAFVVGPIITTLIMFILYGLGNLFVFGGESLYQWFGVSSQE